MKTPHLVSAVLILGLLNGCAMLSNANNWAPIPSQKEFETFSKRVQSGDPLSKFKTELVTFIGEYHSYAAERRKMEWESSGMTAVGGLAAVLGGLADKTGLLNTGAGVAGIGLITSSRYNFAQQSQIYFAAVKKMACVDSKVGSIPDTVLDDAKSSPDQNAAKIAQGAMQQLVGAVDTIRIDATNGILGITPSAPTRDELITMFKSYLPAAAAAGGGAAALAKPDPVTERRREAGELVKTMLTDVGTCVKT